MIIRKTSETLKVFDVFFACRILKNAGNHKPERMKSCVAIHEERSEQMDQLLKKFEKIEINHSSSLEKEDQEFCEKQQQIYERVLRHYRAMFRGMKMLHDKEVEFHSKLEEKNVSPQNIYHKDLIIANANAQMDIITSVHQELVERIISYFRSRYGLDLQVSLYKKYISIKKPKEPCYFLEPNRNRFSEEWRQEREAKRAKYEKEYKTYQEEMLLRSKLDYHAVIDDIFFYLDGFNFKEKLHQEIKQEVKKAMEHRGYKLTNSKISFTGLTLTKLDYSKNYEILLGSDRYKAILRALTYYDSGQKEKKIYPDWEKRFFTNSSLYTPEKTGIFDEHEVEGGKVIKFKYFKNGRWDVIFKNSTYARKFAAEYLQDRKAA